MTSRRSATALQFLWMRPRTAQRPECSTDDHFWALRICVELTSRIASDSSQAGLLLESIVAEAANCRSSCSGKSLLELGLVDLDASPSKSSEFLVISVG